MEEHKVLVKTGYKIHYYVSGNPDGQTVVFLHPAFGDHRCFYKQLDFFNTHYRIITVDLLGHGQSQVGKSSETIEQSSNHVFEILKQERRSKVHVVGVSMGAMIAQDFAQKHQEIAQSLTVLGGYNINKNNAEIAKAQRKEMGKWLFKMIFSMKAFRRYIASISVSDKLEQEKYYQFASGFTRKSFRAMSGLGKLVQERQQTRRLYPLLILVGENDLNMAVRFSENWHRDEPESKLKILAKAGHCANMDQANLFNTVLLEFFQTSVYTN